MEKMGARKEKLVDTMPAASPPNGNAANVAGFRMSLAACNGFSFSR
jgi:hypothetical protein